MKSYRHHFPILSTGAKGNPLIYLDSASTTQKPLPVLEAVSQFYRQDFANVHRGIYELSVRATILYEDVRKQVQAFIGAKSEREIVFTRGATDGLNLLAECFVQGELQPGDEVWTTLAEHHSNLLPWQQAVKRTGATLRWLPLHEDGTVDVERASAQFTDRTKLVAIALISNVLGVIQPVRALADLIHQRGGIIVVDGAQAVPHHSINVQELNCDFLVFSGHKAYAPTGVGVLYGRSALLAKLRPVRFGGEMVEEVTVEGASWRESPWKFEAGTPPIAEVIGLGAALTFLQEIGFSDVRETVTNVTRYAWARLGEIKGLIRYGPERRGSLISFTLDGIHPHDVATVLDTEGIAVRAGQHCAQPLMRFLGLSSTVRISFGLYNTKEEIDRLVESLQRAQRLWN